MTAPHIKMEQDDVKAQARAQQEMMDAKMRAVRESITQQKTEEIIDPGSSSKSFNVALVGTLFFWRTAIIFGVSTFSIILKYAA